MNYDRATVEHAARALFQRETGRWLPSNSEMTPAQQAELAGYIRRAEKALPFVRVFNVEAIVAADRDRPREEVA